MIKIKPLFELNSLFSNNRKIPEMGSGDKKKSSKNKKKVNTSVAVHKSKKALRSSPRTQRISRGAPVYLSSVMSDLVEEIIDASVKCLGKRKRIAAADVLSGVRGDDDLNLLTKSFSVFLGQRLKGVSKAVTLIEAK